MDRNTAEKKLRKIQNLNDEFIHELKEVKDILICIAATDLDTNISIILNAIEATGKTLDLKIKTFENQNDLQGLK